MRVASFVCVWGPALSLSRLGLVLRGTSCVVFLLGPWTVTRSPLHDGCRGISACYFGLLGRAGRAGRAGLRLVLRGSFACKRSPDTRVPGLALAATPAVWGSPLCCCWSPTFQPGVPSTSSTWCVWCCLQVPVVAAGVAPPPPPLPRAAPSPRA